MPSTLRPRPVKKHKSTVKPRVSRRRVSRKWFDLPFEMREMVIDRMDPKTRCRFARCSKICEKEAKMSRNYLKIITVDDDNNNPLLTISHSLDTVSYQLVFKRTRWNELTEVVYEVNNKGMKWTKTEDGKPSNVRAKYYQEYLDKYRNSIKTLKVYDTDFLFFGHNAKHLRNLIHIELPFAKLDVIRCGFLSWNQIIHAASVELTSPKFTFDEIVTFKGSKYDIRPIGFDENTIAKYLKMWKNGELSENIEDIEMCFPQKVTYRKIIEGLDVFEIKENSVWFNLKFHANHQDKNKFYTEVAYLHTDDNNSTHFWVQKRKKLR